MHCSSSVTGYFLRHYHQTSSILYPRPRVSCSRGFSPNLASIRGFYSWPWVNTLGWHTYLHRKQGVHCPRRMFFRKIWFSLTPSLTGDSDPCIWLVMRDFWAPVLWTGTHALQPNGWLGFQYGSWLMCVYTGGCSRSKTNIMRIEEKSEGQGVSRMLCFWGDIFIPFGRWWIYSTVERRNAKRSIFGLADLCSVHLFFDLDL